MMQRILVIEDEPSVAENIAYALSTEGFEPVCRSTGRDGLQELLANRIALLILDVGLPDINGFELCKEIRKTSTLPIIFLTARADEIDRVVGLEIGADDYLVKPFSPRELTARVKGILRRCQDRPAVAAPVPAGRNSFEIDAERFCIRYHGHLLNLTRYEFKILEILLRAPGRVYSREKLMDMAWEEPEASMDRTVDAHIKSLRAKLKAIHPDADPIVTHRGLGYSLKENG